jgi:hypothetical protein
MIKAGIGFILAALAMAACQGGAALREVGRSEAVSIAAAHFNAVLPQTRGVRFRPVVVDEGPNWRVHFQPPPDSIGSFVVIVDKRSGRVVRHVINQ